MKSGALPIPYLAREGCRFVLQAAKNCVKTMLGQKPRRDERLVFFQQYLLHLTSIRRIRGITSVANASYEGSGFQAHMIMNAINFSRISGLPYLHTPFSLVGHADRPMPEWSEAWESLFNLGAGEALCSADRSSVVNYRFVQPELDLCFGKGLSSAHRALKFREMIPVFKAKYYANRSPRRSEQVTVAVHIRRGDVTPESSNELFTSNEVVARTIKSVKSSLDAIGDPYRISIFSEGDPAEFGELPSLGVEFFLNSDAIWTMQELIEADILVMANSSFSYYAAIISDGLKIYEPREITALDAVFFPSYDWRVLSKQEDWIACQPDGSIEAAELNRQIARLLQVREEALFRAPSANKTPDPNTIQ